MVSDRFGSRIPAFAGSMVSAVALLSMTQLTVNSTAGDVFIRLAVMGLGVALFQSPTNKALMSQLPTEKSGVASGIIATTRNLGMVFAVCYAGLLIHLAISPELMQASQLQGVAAANLTSGLHLVVIFGAILSVGMAVLSLAGLKNKKKALVKYEQVALKKTIQMEQKMVKTVGMALMVMVQHTK
jgi:nitrate/nitrite transporter NarK